MKNENKDYKNLEYVKMELEEVMSRYKTESENYGQNDNHRAHDVETLLRAVGINVVVTPRESDGSNI